MSLLETIDMVRAAVGPMSWAITCDCRHAVHRGVCTFEAKVEPLYRGAEGLALARMARIEFLCVWCRRHHRR